MKAHIYIIGVWMAMSASLLAQSEQRITVLEYNGKEGKTPLAQVGVTVLNAGSALSDDKGEATLKFRTLHAGDRVSVRRIEKAGFEIFNSQAIEQWSVSPQRPFQIVLCRSEKFMALRDQYSRVASDSYAKQYKAAQARLAAERKKTKMLEETYQQKMLDLENQYQQQLEDLENYVDQFARIDLSELNNQQSELIKLVQDGKIDKAIQKYESADYQAQYKKQCEEIAKIDRAQAQLTVVEAQKRSEREKVFQAIHRQIATYRLAGGRENFQKVTDLMKSVADADTTNLEAVFDYARHALNQSLYAESETYFNIYIHGCQNSPALQASAYSLLGQSYMLKHEFEKAEVAYLHAISILQPLADKEPERFAHQLLNFKYNLSNNYIWTNQIEKAKQIQITAVQECENIYTENPSEYAELLVNLHSTNCRVLQFLGDSEAAMVSGKRALEIARSIYEHNEETSSPIIVALSSMGQICYMSENWQELTNCQKEYSIITEELYQKNPDSYLIYVKDAFNNLADAQIQLYQLDNAEQSFNKAESYTKIMVEKDPSIHFYDQFTVYETGARLYKQKGNIEKMIFYRDAALKAYEQMQPGEKEQFVNEYEGLKNLK